MSTSRTRQTRSPSGSTSVADGVGTGRSAALYALVVLLVLRTASDTVILPAAASSVANFAIVMAATASGFIFSARNAGRGRSRIVGPLLSVALVSTLYAVIEFGPDYYIISELLRLGSIVGIVVTARYAVAETGFIRTGSALVKAGLPAVLLLDVAFVTHIPFIYGSGSGRAFGTFQQTNSAAAFVAIFLVLTLYLLIRGRQGWLVIPLAAGVVAAVSTLSLGGLTTLLAGTAALVFLAPLKAFIKVLTALLVTGTVIAVLASGVLADRLAQLQTTTSFQNASQGDISNSLDWRFYNWTRLLQYWIERPLTGWGLGSTNFQIQPIGKQPHSEYVRLLVETGLIGVAFVAAVLIALLIALLRPTSRTSRWGIALGVSLIICALVNGFASNTVSYVPAMYLLVAAWAVAAGDRRATAAPAVEETTS